MSDDNKTIKNIQLSMLNYKKINLDVKNVTFFYNIYLY